MIFLFWACAQDPTTEGTWLSGDVPERESILDAEAPQEQLVGGLFGEFSVVGPSGFSTGRGGYTVLRMGESGEEFLCGLNYDVDFVAVANDCTDCQFAFEIYEQEAVAAGDLDYCDQFGVSTEEVGNRAGFIGYGNGRAYTKDNSGSWYAFGVAEYSEGTQRFDYYEMSESGN